jgi:hypothetical protein
VFVKIYRHAGFAVLTALILTASATTPASAQGLGIGIKLGPVFNSFDSSDTNFKNRVGFMGGLFLGTSRNKVVGIQTEFNFMQKKGEGTTIPGTVEINYLDLPVLLRLGGGAKSMKGVAFYVVVGPVFDIKLSETLTGVNLNNSNFESFDMGVAAGGGMEITRFIIEGRYQQGFRQIVTSNLLNTSKVTTKSFSILFGFRFN